MNLLSTLAATRDFPMPIVDAHQHLWDLSTGHYPTKQDQYDKNFFLGDYRKICRDYMPTDYVDALKGYHVIGSVHIQVARAMDEQVAETEWLETMHQQFGLPSVVVGHVSSSSQTARLLAQRARGACRLSERGRKNFGTRPAARQVGYSQQYP